MIGTDEMCVALDADCPNCGWPERITPLSDPGSVFGCRRCDYESSSRDV